MGICGSGMSSLALWYARRGFSVTGCDRDPGENLDELRNAGIKVMRGHDVSHVEDADSVVFSAAVPFDHPELVRARSLGKTVLRRSEALAELANDSILYAVSGAHGKTTTTAMTGWILQECGLDPTVMVGGRIGPWGGNFRPGSRVTVVEADEYDRAFLRLRPSSAAVTSFAIEHLECYGTPEALSLAFGIFLEMTRPGGRAIVPAAHRELADWAERIGRQVVVTGPGGQVNCVQLSQTGWEQEYRLDGMPGVLPLPGEHNLRNAESAIALAEAAGVSREDSIRALSTFPGVCRRLEKLGELHGSVIISDYAHHFDEVEAAIRAVSKISPGRVGVVFQPHLYSRTASQSGELGKALSLADWSVVLPIYPAREKPIEGITSELIVEACQRIGGICSIGEAGELRSILEDRDADAVIFMGAGSIDGMARNLLGGKV